jgi:hypothetical protein
MCLDRMNSLFSLIRIFSYLHKGKRLTTQATIATTLAHRQEGHEQLRKEHMLLASLRPHAPKSRGHLPHPLSGPCCIQARAAPARVSTRATNTERDPQQTLLAAVVSIRSSSSSITVDIDAAREDS